ncbi:FKBP-type peptidyl-prolyl cis-trans isomerase [Actinobacillus pleuropneumoniae]|uniref:Peptidyl-prolyl cis-trans isomerase n=3 Tax=Actinobacillus pleuropneumoniae TaxID=715 RepID=B0BRW6_ACTPJ|nr:FKBP-type peptidyl-prolyl cis-trans isomerase [Actinobacillus pleuropneumoniae]ABY70225.1 FKBP-type peptidyl-prolyl cis-trans isomerase [Actinobacillus pleuropneumoniae serovar 3 str. JL03]ASU15489.1 putative FKBP-type peptidyl-prolyl cis-trans isomerase [Actinobacillus pleuropneumoniae]AWG96062.1 FKBP-type peptidyl-prolyl cis-trans isomerase [Actinobacillus pleuropneumoniae serovar 1 str. 4074]AXA22132.1 FKBP-type peptidyl-prolyl cis-trans isomerase [Actinobacillus pleuropneumoniae]EFL7787
MLKNKLSVLAIVAGTFVSAQTAFAADQKFIDDSSYAVGVLMGKNIEGVVESQKEIFSYNQDKILAGVQDTIKKTGKLTDEDLQKQLKSLDTYLASQESKIAAEKSKATVEAGNKFRTDYEKQSGVKKTASGLLYKIEKAGTGESPKAEDTVKVHYKGTLTDGTVFDSSYDRGEPIEFQLNQLIPGWIEAIPMLKKGGKMEIVVPPELGYGERQAGKIPASSTLKFEIELLDFKAAEAKK